ncbi:hypothetical protein [Aquiluna sp. KACHI24]|uniref:hypothetical protein n=1 Tax=Aquiluna sp. KACHI24 TaxID=2968831 RepID=UPI00220ECD41|nr:hypothetical protein [Aquiluna sp. KACHI24]BDP99759.1 hypothetical protein AKACHI_00960 [Aquiluna sp. KACHI24]
MKKLIAVGLLLALLPVATPAAALSNQTITKTVVNSAATISSANKSALSALLFQNPATTKLSCVGFTKLSPTTKEKTAALAKAKSFCSYAKARVSSLSVTSITQTTKITSNIGKVNLVLTVPSYPATALSFDNLDVNWVARTATSRVLERYESSAQSSVAIDYHVGPNVPAAGVTREKSLITKASRLWADVFTKNFTVVLFSEKDAEWAEQKRLELGGDLPGGITGYLARSGAKDQCILGFASKDKAGNPIYFNCIHSSGNRYAIADHTAIHEHFHMVQNSLYKPNVLMPLWLNEGAPTFFGFALGYGSTDRNGRLSEQFYLTSPAFDPFGTGTVDPTRFRTWAKTASNEDIAKVFELMEADPENREAFNQYGLGAIAAQALIAVGGIEDYLDFIRATNQTDWKIAFKNQYGLTPAEFYLKLAPYIRSLGNKYL